MNVTQEEIGLSIIKYLLEEIEREKNDQNFRDSLDVAVDCIQKAYNLEGKDSKTAHNIPILIERSKAIFDPKLAEAYREEGNVLMSDKKFTEALSIYNKAILHDSSNHIHYGNRAAAYLKLGKFSNVIEDANTSINLNPNFHKGYARKAIALMGQGDFYNAQLCLEKALELDPENATYKENLLKCKAKLTQSSAVDGSPFATFDQLFTNPNFINMAQSVIQNPEFQQVFTNLADGAASNEGGTFDFSTIMNTFQTAVENLQNDDPETLENLRNAFSPNQPQ